MKNKVKFALIQQALMRWENAVLIAMAILLTAFWRNPFDFWPDWGWGALALVGVLAITLTSLGETSVQAAAITDVLYQEYNPGEIKTPAIRASFQQSLKYRSTIEQMITASRDGVVKTRLTDLGDKVNQWTGAVRNNFFDRLSGARLFQELRLILQEENPIPAISRLAEFDLLKPVHPRLIFDAATRALLERVQAVLSWYDLLYLEDKYQRWLVYFLGLVEPLHPQELEEMLGGFNLSPKLARTLVQGKAEADQALIGLFRLGEPSRVQIYHVLAPLATEYLLYMLAKSRQEPVRRVISLYFTHLKQLKPELRGRDLVAMGYKPGPLIKEMLEGLLEARINEKVKTRKEEKDFIRRSFGPP